MVNKSLHEQCEHELIWKHQYETKWKKVYSSNETTYKKRCIKAYAHKTKTELFFISDQSNFYKKTH